MKSTRQLLDLDQRLWRGNNTRTRLDDATLARDIAEDSIPGLTSKPRIFDAAIGAGAVHGKAIRAKTLAAAGAKPQRPLWAGAGSTDSSAPDTRSARALAARDTIGTSSEMSLQAVANRGRLHGVVPAVGRGADAMPHQIGRAGVAVQALAAQRQQVKAQGFVKPQPPWLPRIAEASAAAASART